MLAAILLEQQNKLTETYMRNLSLLCFLFLGITVFAQKIVDTTEIYNGQLARKRIEFNSTGEIVKEIYYHPSGNVKTEYVLENGERIRWITYDDNGKTISEWNDPEFEVAKHRNMRNITFFILLIFIAGLIIAGSKASYQKTYYSLLCLTVIYPLIILFLERRIVGNEENQILRFAIASTLFIFPGMLFVLSMFNFVKRVKIPLVTTIFAILISLGFLMFYFLTMKMAGAGMLG